LKKTLFTLFLLATVTFSFAQENFKHFRISPVLSHTYIPEATSEGKKNIIAPSIGLDIEYWMNEKWGIGLHNDMELMNFEIEKDENLFIEREYPIVLTLDGLWKFHKEWVLVVGSGIEIEKNKSLFIVRTGLEYEIEFGKHWDVSPSVLYDYRSENYGGTFSVGIGIGKRF
jgi:hypothetical protein